MFFAPAVQPFIYGTWRYTFSPSARLSRFKTRGELRNLDHLRAGLRMLKVSEGLRNGTMWNEDMTKLTKRKSWYCEGCQDPEMNLVKGREMN